MSKFGMSFAVVVLAAACGPKVSEQASVTPPESPAEGPATPGAPAAPKPQRYPVAARGTVVDDYHGTKVADPYRWLEDVDAPETKAWVDAENKITFGFLDQIPQRAAIKARLTKLWNYEKYSTPTRKGGRVFFTKNDGLQNQAVVYWAPSLDAEPKVLLDPNTLAADGTVALSGSSVSEDGKLYAYGLAASGSDWNEWRVREVDTGKDRPDVLKWIKFSSASWTKDGKGFFYGRYDEPKAGQALEEANYWQKLYYHKLGTEQAEDVLIYKRTAPEEKEWGFGGEVTEDGRYLLISVWKGTGPKNLIFYKDLKDPKALKPGKDGAIAEGKVVELVPAPFAAEFEYIANDGPVFYFKTDVGDAQRGKVISIDLRKPDPKAWKTIVPQTDEALRATSVVGNSLFLTYLKDAHSVVRVTDLRGKALGEVPLPGFGSAGGFFGRRNDKDTFYSYTSFTTPPVIHRLDVKTLKSTVFKAPTLAFDAGAYETRQVFYTSKDGTKVPMFLSARRGLTPDGETPVYLYGYGGFSNAMTPSFSVSALVWMEMGGIYAVANIRGGSEYGEAWHEAGTKHKKQNVFDDFIAAAEWFTTTKVSNPRRIAIAGGSNGGLLVGAVMTQRPDLIGAALPAVGVMDMLRFHLFTIGWAWVDDYGSSADPEMFKTLAAYSPYHNLKDGTAYPPTLVTTADHDDRVVPGHSFKFAAALQHAQTGDAPVLIRVDVKAGHGAGKPTTKLIDETGDKLAFLVKVFGLQPQLD